jgi:hypothetical protein
MRWARNSVSKALYKQSLEDKGVSNQEIRNEPIKGEAEKARG